VAINRTIVVFQSATLNATFDIQESLPNAATAENKVLALNQNSSTDISEAVTAIREALGEAGDGVGEGDVAIRGAAVKGSSATNYSVSVTASIFLYIPKGVHRRDVDAGAAGGTLKNGSSRRMLQQWPRAQKALSWLSNTPSISDISRHGHLHQERSHIPHDIQSYGLYPVVKGEACMANKVTSDAKCAATKVDNVNVAWGPGRHGIAAPHKRSLLATTLLDSLAAVAGAASTAGATDVVLAPEGTAEVDHVAVRRPISTIMLASTLELSSLTSISVTGILIRDAVLV
jgi:hypothetical protein